MPTSPEHCEYFLRFSSKISGSCGAAEKYILEVNKIAGKWFGHRAKPWHECADDAEPVYDWKDVNDADKKLRELEKEVESQREEVKGDVGRRELRSKMKDMVCRTKRGCVSTRVRLGYVGILNLVTGGLAILKTLRHPKR